MPYPNDFATGSIPELPNDIAPRAWTDQPVTVPLSEWVDMKEQVVRLSMALAQKDKQLAEKSEELRHKDYEIARLRGEGVN